MADSSSTQKIAACWGRVQVKPDDIGRLGFEIRVIAGHVALQTMWFDPCFLPDPMDRIFADVQLPSELTNRAMRGTVLGFAPCGFQDARLQLGRDHLWLPTRMPGFGQSPRCGLAESFLPMRDGGCGSFEPPTDIGITPAGRQH
jgi:hypothetical protein